MIYQELFELAYWKKYPLTYYNIINGFDNESTISEEKKNKLLFLELCLIQKWLREEHGIHVQPQKTFHDKTYIIGRIPIEFRINGELTINSYGSPISYLSGTKGKFKTYEEALIRGIQVSLESLK